MITLEQIHFRRENRDILSNIHLQVGPGEQWVILGKNGSGKTTILELMNGYQFPTSGKVTVLGNVFGTCDVREVRKRIGYISQSLMEKLNLSDPVWEVVATGEFGFLRFYEEIPAEVIAKAEAMLESVQLLHVKDQPLGTLSQGERKKAMLARSLMSDPAILIMDEPCSGLDLYEREKLLANINELSRRNVTLVYVTHHIEEIMPLFTHVALINQGRILAAGPKRDVLTNDAIYDTFQVPVTIDWFGDRPWAKVTE
ncbi:MAG: ATP-binding cassette domain-containing protein [Paenibacillaceae bacterium]|nr:ATP-binding cassette domain-containing protein [Paenibacillaceae bacterium]